VRGVAPRMWQLLGAALRYRRVPSKGFKQLTGKYGNKNYYKGKGVKSTGHHTKLGAFAATGPPTCPACPCLASALPASFCQGL